MPGAQQLHTIPANTDINPDGLGQTWEEHVVGLVGSS